MKQFKKAVARAMHKYTDKMKKDNDSDMEYDFLSEMSICFALLEYDLFYKEDENDG